MEDPTPKVCACGCGEPTNRINENDATKGLVKGEYRTWRSGHHRRKRTVEPSDYRVEDRGFVSPCWIWRGQTDSKGYAFINRGGYNRAHRLTYEQFREPIPHGLVIDHLCSQTSCVNPWHLEAVTASENTRRARLHQRLRADALRVGIDVGTPKRCPPTAATVSSEEGIDENESRLPGR